MTINFNGISPTGYLITLIISLVGFTSKAQQNSTLFFMHSIPEANFVNPAVQGKCGNFIGLPILSSVYMNIANSGFTPGDVVTLYTDNSIKRKSDFNTEKVKGLNYFVSDVNVTLMAVGMQRNDYYYTFSAIEKEYGVGIYTSDLVAFALRGDNEFEGRTVQLKGTRAVFNYLREYALGVSKKYSDRLTLGLKAKLLFGKFNLNTGNSSFGIYVENGTDNILFDIDGGYNSSLPYSLRLEGTGNYRFYKRYDNSITRDLMNPRNPGFAVDFGIIYRYSDRVTLSGSLLDLGMIFYRSNLTNYTLQGNDSYYGPFGTGPINDRYLYDVFDDLNQNMNEEITYQSYTYFLDPKLYLGASYALNKKFDLNMLLYNRYHPGKLQTGATVSLLTRPSDKLEASVSVSYMNRSFTNLGVGFGYGVKPFQLYVVSDNIFGFILPFSSKNINLRCGINVFFGCKERFNIDQCGCDWLKDSEDRRKRVEKARHNK